MKSLGGRLGRWEKAKLGNLWHWINGKMEKFILLLH